MCTCVYVSGHGCTSLCQPFSVCRPCSPVLTGLDVGTRHCTGLSRCVGPMHLCLPVRRLGNVTVLTIFDMKALCTCVHASGRRCTSRNRSFSVCRPCVPVLTGPDVGTRHCTSPSRCVGTVPLCLRVRTCVYVPVLAVFGV